MEGKRVINIGKPVDLPDAATLYIVSDAENSLWKEIATVNENIDAENVKIYDKLARFETYLLRYYLDKTIPKT